MSKKSPSYYLKSVKALGWGEKEAILDRQRQDLLTKYIAGKKILDVGCGYGIYVDFLASSGLDAYGLDFTEEFIKSARKTKKGEFIEGNAEKLPYSNRFFDTVLLFDILEHGDDSQILEEAKRVCKERILVIVPKVVDKNLEQSGVIFRHYLDKSHLREYAEVDIKSLVEKVGLKLIYLEAIHPLYNETIFLSLFNSSLIWKKIVRKIVFWLLPKHSYPTEYFAVLEK